MDDKKRKSALVTGASKGMGRAIALALAAKGYDVAVCARNLRDLEILEREIKERNGEVNVFIKSCDFALESDVKALTIWAEKHFPILDVLVNNVGLYKRVSLLDEGPEVMRESMEINLFAPHQLSTHFGRIMRDARKGHIFNISSIASRQPVVAAGSYTVTKAALAGLTNVMREELREYGVKLTEIIPGATLTSSWAGTTIPPEQFISPEDVAKAVIVSLEMSQGANFDEILIKPVKDF